MIIYLYLDLDLGIYNLVNCKIINHNNMISELLKKEFAIHGVYIESSRNHENFRTSDNRMFMKLWLPPV